MEQTVVELVAALRRAGLEVSPAETCDAVAALAAVGLARRADVEGALEATLLRRARDAPLFARTLGRFFDRQAGAERRGLFEELAQQGYASGELEVLRELLEGLAAPAAALRAVMGGSHALAALLDASVAGLPRPWIEDPARAGFATMRALDAAELPRARTQLGALRAPLSDALGVRGLMLADAVEGVLSGLHGQARERLVESRDRAALGDPRRQPFEQLDADELARMERLVQRLAERLLASEKVRQRRARAGRLDGRATLRRALATAGVPAQPVFRRARPRRPVLWVLCDISDSVRATARLSLTFLHAAQRAFGDLRSFVFVSDVGETTRLFAQRPAAEAIQRAYQGEVVRVADNSNYGHALQRFEALTEGQLDARGTLLVLGDGRTNHFPPGDETLARLARRAGRTVWFNPQPRARWYEGDSAMARYERHVAQAHPVHDYASFEQAARGLVALCRRSR